MFKFESNDEALRSKNDSELNYIVHRVHYIMPLDISLF